MKFILLILIVFLSACNAQPLEKKNDEKIKQTAESPEEKYKKLFESNRAYISDGFDFPVGKPNAKGYYNAQGFGGKKYHLGDDWNASTGGNSDLGHPIFSIANGYVTEAVDKKGGWGPVVRVVHYHKGKFYESLYAHCDEMFVQAGDWVKRGQKIATIGNNEGMYLAHLHLEIRDKADLPLGGGYSKNTEGYLDPTIFINNNRASK
jgi:murein DD-endopeptidase MepM/ murein hydrolase activator NlpD